MKRGDPLVLHVHWHTSSARGRIHRIMMPPMAVAEHALMPPRMSPAECRSRSRGLPGLGRCGDARPQKDCGACPKPIRVIPPHAFVDQTRLPECEGSSRSMSLGCGLGSCTPSRGRFLVGIITVTTRPASTSCPGAMRLKFGAGGRSVVGAGPGHFVHVPARVVHRESNPTDLPSSAVIARAGIGEPTVNVDGPDFA